MNICLFYLDIFVLNHLEGTSEETVMIKCVYVQVKKHIFIKESVRADYVHRDLSSTHCQGIFYFVWFHTLHVPLCTVTIIWLSWILWISCVVQRAIFQVVRCLFKQWIASFRDVSHSKTHLRLFAPWTLSPVCCRINESNKNNEQ